VIKASFILGLDNFLISPQPRLKSRNGNGQQTAPGSSGSRFTEPSSIHEGRQADSKRKEPKADAIVNNHGSLVHFGRFVIMWSPCVAV
jgi:hypothetical protein